MTNPAPYAPPQSPPSLGRQVFQMAWPNIGYAILDSGIGLVDLVLVGKLGAEAIGGVGLSRQLYIVVTVLAISISAGATPIVGQAFGAGDLERVRRTARAAINATVIAGLAVGALLFVIAPFGLRFLQAPPAVYPLGLRYVRALSPGVVFIFLNFAMVSLFRGIGQVRVPLYSAIAAHAVNIVVSYALIFGVHPWISPIGIAGAAYGTVAGRGVGFAICLLVWRRRLPTDQAKARPWWSAGLLKQIMAIGLPLGGMHMLRMGAHFFFFQILATAGGLALAAGTVTLHLRMLLILPSLAFQMALVTLVSQSLGADDPAGARRFTMHTLGWGSLIVGLVTAVIIAFAGPIVGLVAGLTHSQVNAQIVALGGPMVRISFVGQFFATGCIILGGAFFGGGDVKAPFVFTVVSEWLVLIPAAWFIRYHSGWPIAWIWVAFVLSPVVLLGLYAYRFQTGVWQRRL